MALSDTIARHVERNLLDTSKFATEGNSYQPLRGEAVTVTALLGAERKERRYNGDGIDVVFTRLATISMDPASEKGGVVAPQVGAKFTTAGGDKYMVETLGAIVGSMIDLHLIRIAPVEISRPEYRGGR